MFLSLNSRLQEGKYIIKKVLGQGGFGITYLASLEIESNQLLGKIRTTVPVTIKEFFMKEHCNRDELTSQVSVSSHGAKELINSFKRKFIKEAQTLASLQHPNIVKIYDVFEENDTAYYAMEYINGGSLSDYVSNNGPMPEQMAIRYITHVASALDYLHSRQMNHLDVKPGNILINAVDEAVLIDFGLSKHYDDEGQATSTTPVGISHGYAPMEQYKRGGVNEFSPATDIYSLGATLYKLLTGQTPPDASDINDEGLPNIPANISDSTRQAIISAMQPRRKDRPQNIDDFLSILNITSICKENCDDVTEILLSKDNKFHNGSTHNIGTLKPINSKELSEEHDNTLSILKDNWQQRNMITNIVFASLLIVVSLLRIVYIYKTFDNGDVENLHDYFISIISFIVSIVSYRDFIHVNTLRAKSVNTRNLLIAAITWCGYFFDMGKIQSHMGDMEQYFPYWLTFAFIMIFISFLFNNKWRKRILQTSYLCLILYLFSVLLLA